MATNPVYLEIIDFFASGTTPQAVVDFQQSPAAQHRALELLDLGKEDRFTPEQESELSTSFAWPMLVHARCSTASRDLRSREYTHFTILSRSPNSSAHVGSY